MKKIVLLSLLVILLAGCNQKTTDLSILQLNLWHQGTQVPDGFSGIVDIIVQTDPDVAFLCEINNHDNQPFIPLLVNTLKEKGYTYYGESFDLGVGILSKYPLQDSKVPFILENNSRPMIKSTIQVEGQTIVLYSAHLHYQHYECYMPRGYSGTTWEKLEAPITDPEVILEANRLSYRDEAIEEFLKDAAAETEKGHLVIMGGDFNEPSHLDWQEDTKDLFDHNGAVVNWDCSVMLHRSGYKDIYRELYPNPVTHPGFTFPSANKDAETRKLTWAPEADERDRIDFIYYYATPDIRLKSGSMVGPSETVVRCEQVPNDSSDSFIEPQGIWPTDHKGTFATFSIRKKQ